jgi:hypothetical protein
MPRARASLAFLSSLLGACQDPPPLPAVARREPSPPAATAPEPANEPLPAPSPAAEVRVPARRTLRARWSPVAQQLLGERFAAALTQDDAGFAVELQVEPDRSAIDRIARGEAALAIVAAEVTTHDLARGLEATSCGRYVPVLVVNESNPVRSLSARAMRETVTGQTRHWLAVGGRAGVAIELAVPEATPLRQRAAALLIAGDRFAGDAVKLAGDGGILDFVRGRPNALGLVSAAALDDGPAAGGVRPLAIDGALPGTSGYRWQTPLSVVTRVGRDEATERVLARLRRVRT